MISESVLRLAAALGPEELASAIGAIPCRCGNCKGFEMSRIAFNQLVNPRSWGIIDRGELTPIEPNTVWLEIDLRGDLT